jgi:acetyl esterase/lipase
MSKPPNRRAFRPWCSRICIGITAAFVVIGCSQGAVPSAMPTTPATSTAIPPPLPASACADDQSGRYVVESFVPAPVTTVPIAGALLADIYQPSSDPARCRVGVIWVHGGGFTQATRNGPAEQAWGAALAARGFVLVSVDYRLGHGEPFGLDQATDPARIAIVNNAIADAITAVTWLRAVSPQWRVDPHRIVIGGTSAGAITALGAAMTGPAADRPCAVVAVSGDLDPAWVGSNPVPALLIHGDSDVLVPYQSAVDAVQSLTDAGGQAQLVTVEGAGHEITGVPTPDMIDVVARWLREVVAAGCS